MVLFNEAINRLSTRKAFLHEGYFGMERNLDISEGCKTDETNFYSLLKKRNLMLFQLAMDYTNTFICPFTK